MKTTALLTASAALTCTLFSTFATAGGVVGTSFTYQGQLKQSGVPANDFFDIQFTLFDQAAIVAGPICRDQVAVVNGLFQVELDFGDAFNGESRELRVAVRTSAVSNDCGANLGSYVTLVPRQKITPAPYAMHALSAPAGNTLNAADGSPAGAVFVDDIGRVGIGNPTPLRTVDVFGGLSTLRLTGLTPGAPGAIVELKHLQPQGGIPGAINSPGSIRFLDNTDAVMGSIDMVGLLNVPPNPPTPPRLVISSSNMSMDSTGQFLVQAEGSVDINGAGQVDVESTGSSLRLRTGNATNVFVSSAGNVGIGTSAPTSKLHVVGTTQMTGNTTISGNVTVSTAAGDAALSLPDNAVSSDEILNEPGIASDIHGFVALANGVTTMSSRTINVPTNGHVIAFVSATFSNEAFILPDNTRIHLFIDKTTAPAARSVFFSRIINTDQAESLSAHAVFSVNAGSNTFSVSVDKGGLDSSSFSRLTLLFVPTTYGTTNVEPAPMGEMILSTGAEAIPVALDDADSDPIPLALDWMKQVTQLEERNIELEGRIERLEAMIRSMAETQAP